MTREPDSFVGRVSTALSAIFVLTLVVTATVVAWPAIAGPSPKVAREPLVPAYRSGDAFDAPAGWYQESPYTLVLFAQSMCGACQKAEPYLRTLVAHLDGRASVVLASPVGRTAGEAAFARRLGLADTALVEAPRSLRARRTPTLVVVDRAGHVLGAWEGVGPDDEHATLTAAIDRLLKS
ncbi:MAG: hypothetical protein R2752_01050 [Vicinamibacterales bacterium]